MADNDDYTVQSYQDDLDTNKTDPFTDEVAENPAKTQFGVPESDFKERLDEQLDDGSEDQNSDDVDIEDDQRQNTEG